MNESKTKNKITRMIDAEQSDLINDAYDLWQEL